MKTNRFWIEIVALGTASACALALVIACVGAAGVAIAGRPQSSPALATQAAMGHSRHRNRRPASSSPRSQSSRGNGDLLALRRETLARLGKTAVDCSITCVRGGATFALVDGDKIYLLDGAPDRLKKVAGQRARIVGVVRGDRIKVSSVAAAS